MKPIGSESIPVPAREAIARASQATGVDFTLLVETARRESSFNPSARAPTSSATGLFQFIESTWLETVRRHGAKHGLEAYASQISQVNGRASVADPRLRQQILDLRYDPEISARMGAELARENQSALERRLGRPVEAGEIYAAHVLGAAGAARLIEAAQSGAGSATELFPREAAANPWLFKTRDGRERSAQALMARFEMDGAGGASAPAPMPQHPLVHLARVEIQETPPASPAREADGLRGRANAIDQLAAERQAAVTMAEALIAATRARAMSVLSDGAMDRRDYGLDAYRRMAS